MPIISQVGRRSPRVRATYASILTVLLAGAVTMIYPFLLMLCGSFGSEADSGGLEVIPRYWFDDIVLFGKYMEARYTTVDELEAAHQRTYASWQHVLPASSAADSRWIQAYRAYRDRAEWPLTWYLIAQRDGDRFYRLHARGFRSMLAQRFRASLTDLNRHYRTTYVTWQQVLLPVEQLAARRYRWPASLDPKDIRNAFREYKASVPRSDRIPVNVDGYFVSTYLRPLYPTIEQYNKAHGSALGSYGDLVLASRAPVKTKARQDWETFVRDELHLSFIRLDAELTPGFRSFLAASGRYRDIASYNAANGTSFKSFDELPFPTSMPATERAQEDWSSFIADRAACPLRHIEVYGPRQQFLEFVKGRPELAGLYGAELPLPLAAADYADFLQRKPAIRWEETRRNYIQVIDYILLHGSASVNTLIYCGLTVLATLLINPLAAYALSRFHPPTEYRILLICMATMAFPAEVTMIPAFLLLRSFPLWPLAVGILVGAAALYAGLRLLPGAPERALAIASTGIGIAAGWWLAPLLASGAGYAGGHVSLLNTFWALVLPSMANGYNIYLLKGFFDSLPRELYESAEIDGAGEWTKFWSLTMALSKPILAVLVLGAFVAAYSDYMMALIIIPDRSMWTLMVWLFQLQITAPQAVVYASLVVAAIPTLVIFVMCQNLIIRGIVVPTEK